MKKCWRKEKTMIRSILSGIAAATIVVASHALAEQKNGAVEVWKSPTCGCCGGWIDHMRQSGFEVKINDTASGVLAKIKKQAGLGPDLQSCHTAKIGGYVIEGHVPAKDIERLLEEKPDAIGLTVPGMPLGSPGMDYGSNKEPYEVLLVKKDSSTEVFAKH
jgi:hypothetical protein